MHIPNVISEPSLIKETIIGLGLVGAIGTGLYLLYRDGDNCELEQPGKSITTSKQVTIDVKIPKDFFSTKKDFAGMVIGREGRED